MFKLKALFAALALVIAPLAASAVTIFDPLPAAKSLGGSFSDIGVTSETATFQLNEKANLEFVLTGSSSSEAALLGMTYDIFGTVYTFSSVTQIGQLFMGSGSVAGLTFGPGQFDVTWGTLAGPAQAGFTVTASAIPLPAAGWMLVSALGGMGLLARARRKGEA